MTRHSSQPLPARESDAAEGSAGGSVGGSAGGAVWARTAGEVLAELGSSTTGLSSAQAEQILARTGPNILDANRPISSWRLLTRQFTSPILLILLGATAISGLLGDMVDALIIVTIVLLSSLLGFWQEHSAGRAMQSLMRLVEVQVTALRDGAPTKVPMSAVVPGDIVLLSAGDLVAGDALVLGSRELLVDESVLTGETFPREKRAGVSAADARFAERSNMLFLGTHISSGTGSALIVATGSATEIGEVASRLGRNQQPTGFERGMTSFGLLLTYIMAILVTAIFVVNLLLERPLVDSALFSLALAVGLTPQLLPAIVSISLAEGARRIARERVIVRRLDAIEDFGSMSVLCSDKTGTMTRGRTQLAAALTVDGTPSERVGRLAHLNAALQIGLDNPIDSAILEGSSTDITQASKLDELPYDFSRKRLSVLVSDPDLGPDPVLVTKGAVDPVLAVCAYVDIAGAIHPIGEARAAIDRIFTTLSDQGFRVLAVATRTLPGRTAVTAGDESMLTLAGFLSFADPVKEDTEATLRELADNGISVRMVTGDNRLVAAHVAAEIGLDLRHTLTGREITALTDAELSSMVSSVSVFSELDPLHKERIVRAFRSQGAVVGYLGDGINDAPALQAADVGISVNTAVPVAKQAAAIVLLDKNLTVLLAGVRQGRRTFANTTKYIFITTSANFGNMLSMAVAAAVLPFLPLLAGQILLINLLSDLPGMTIATDSVDAAQLIKPQRWNMRLIRNYMIVFGALSSVFDLTIFAVLRLGYHAEAAEFRSAWFLGSIMTEIGVLFMLRTRTRFYRSRPSRWVVGSSLLALAITLAIPLTPAAAPLQLVTIPWGLTLIVIAVTVLYLASTELLKYFFWKRPPRRTGAR